LLRPTYTFSTNIPSGIAMVQIDSTYRMADAFMGDNNLRKTWLGKQRDVEKNMDFGLRNVATRRKFVSSFRPDVWWNPIDGIKLGLHSESSYMNYMHKISIDAWWNTGIVTKDFTFNQITNIKSRNLFDYIFTYETPLRNIHKKLFVGAHSRILEGLSKNQLYTNWNFSNTQNIRFDLVSLHRIYGPVYQNYTTEWSSFVKGNNDTAFNNSIVSSNDYAQVQYNKTYKTFTGNGKYTIIARTNVAAVMPDTKSYDASYIQAEWITKNTFKKLDINTRCFTRFGWGNNIPTESALYLAGANPEEMAENKYTRTAFFNAASFNQIRTDGFSMLQMGGGLNLRGYTGYYAIQDNGTNTFMNYKGRSGASISTEIEFDKYIKFTPKHTRNWLKIDAYLFADAGSINNGTINLLNIYELLPNAKNGWMAIRADAGLGGILTIKNWGKLEKANPLSIRLDCPFFVNSIPSNFNNDYFSIQRWVIGIGRSF
jgi:hypothetical protein